ncbi:hypothetical protein TI39_contig348g00031 [Zymoseptoria brevis]|uniref:SMP domain-containing protein n=1 Tax=Zymoseptoria brevis TaxID=1047168 RepID=A0A0F4GR20_9PEZI|nr:hypothetical protein TI39_contig348g00031 [Zymoseptoria brevis]
MSGQMTQADAARVQSSQAKSGNDPGFASRAQSAGDRNANSNAGGNSGNSGNSDSNNASGGKK